MASWADHRRPARRRQGLRPEAGRIGCGTTCVMLVDPREPLPRCPHERTASRRRSGRPARVLRRLHRSLRQPHVGALPADDARHPRDADRRLRRPPGRHRARRRQRRDGGGRPAVRPRRALPRDPQRLVQLPLVADHRDRCAERRGDGAEGPRDGGGRAERLRPGADRGGVRDDRAGAPGRRVRPPCRDLRRADAPRRLPEGGG